MTPGKVLGIAALLALVASTPAVAAECQPDQVCPPVAKPCPPGDGDCPTFPPPPVAKPCPPGDGDCPTFPPQPKHG